MRFRLTMVVIAVWVLTAVYVVVYAGCNSEEPFVVQKPNVTIGVGPCGPVGIAPQFWEIEIDDETSFNARAVPCGNMTFLIPLGEYYALREGHNKIEYRAFAVTLGGTIKAAAADVVNLFWVGPPTPTPTPTPVIEPSPTPFVGQYAVTHIEEATGECAE